MIPLRLRPLTPVFFVLCLLLSSLLPALPVEAKSRRGRAVATRSGRKAQVARVARRDVRQRAAAAEAATEETTAQYRLVPDKIEVVEFGSQRASEIIRFGRSATASYTPVQEIGPARKRNVSIDAMRVAQIQQALAGRGFYQGEINGTYDDQTIQSMQRFQASQRIPTTGYPTAHALKRLGLGSW